MRILYVVHQFFPRGYTGTERFVLDLAKQMSKMGHYVEVLTYGIEEDNSDYLIDGNILYKKYYYQNVPVISVKYLNAPNDIDVNIFDERIGSVLEKFIAKDKFDIVHVAHPMRMGYAVKIAHSLDLPIVLTLTDFWLICPRGIFVTSKGELCNQFNITKCKNECLSNFSFDNIQKRMEETKEVFKKVDCFISATTFLKRMFEINGLHDIGLIKFGTDYHNIIPNLKKYSKDNEIVIGYMSSLSPHKGAHILLKAFNSIEVPNIKLKIYGDYISQSYYYDELKNIIKNHKDVEFCGEYKYEDMSDIFNKLDIIAVPSLWWENSPLVLLSALAHKVPAIVSNLGGMTEVIKNDENGFTFEAGNVKSLARVLQKVGDNPAILNEMKNKIQYPPRIEEEAFEYENVYSRLVNGAIG